MSEKEEEQYSAYMTYQTQYITVFALFSGFIFAAIVVVLSQYPNVAQIHAQAGLLALNLTLDVYLYELNVSLPVLSNCVRIAPKLPPFAVYRKRYEVLEMVLVWSLLAAVVPIMFLLWNLLYLSLASAILSVITVIAGYEANRPYNEFIREHPWIRK
jgi:hypothetical protein